MSRVWFYNADRWDGGWKPYFGSDEYGRRTIVLKLPRRRYIVIAYWTCHCEQCVETRAQTAEVS